MKLQRRSRADGGWYWVVIRVLQGGLALMFFALLMLANSLEDLAGPVRWDRALNVAGLFCVVGLFLEVVGFLLDRIGRRGRPGGGG